MQFQTKNNSKDDIWTNNKVNLEGNYFAGDPNRERDSDKTTIKIHNEFSNVFTGIGCFKSAFWLKV